MPDAALNDIIASVRERLSQELDAQLRTFEERHREAVAAAREEARTQAAADFALAKAEAEQQAAEALARTRRELEQALANERQLGQARLDSERRRAAEQLEQAREVYEAERLALAVSTSQASTVAAAPLLDAFRRIDEAASVSETLAAMVRAASSTGPSALFVVNGPHLEEWSVAGIEPLAATNTGGRGIIGEALTSATSVRSADGRTAAAPVVLDHVPVAVLFGEATGEWDNAVADVIEAIARYGAAHLGYLTALRTAQARQWLAGTNGGTAVPAASPQVDDEGEAAARRFARLLVSEIKLYNEAAVSAGRERGDLLQRLGPEIERARRLYEERVPPAVHQRGQHFQDELVQTLAGGDPSRLA